MAVRIGIRERCQGVWEFKFSISLDNQIDFRSKECFWAKPWALKVMGVAYFRNSKYWIFILLQPKEIGQIKDTNSSSCTISTCRFGDVVALIALKALTRLQGYQCDWRGIQGVSKCLWAFSGLLSLLTRVTSGITNNNRYMFLKATRLSRRQEGWAGIGFSINSLFLMLLLSAMTIDHW